MDENQVDVVEVMDGTDIPLPPTDPIDDGIVIPDDVVVED